MFFNIDSHNGLAIYDQIVRQIKFHIATGSLQPAELIPSVRELARDLAVNPNTVARAYRELQSENLLETVRGTGLQVTTQAPAKCKQHRVQLIRDRLKSALGEALHSGLSASDVRTLVADELTRLEQQESPT